LHPCCGCLCQLRYQGTQKPHAFSESRLIISHPH
jgi:hypothetical protein